MKKDDKIEKWLEDDSFMEYMQKRTIEMFNHILNNYPYDPQYEELDECFDRDDRYVVPLVDYLVYRLHRARLKRNSKKRREGICGFSYRLSCSEIVSRAFRKISNGFCWN